MQRIRDFDLNTSDYWDNVYLEDKARTSSAQAYQSLRMLVKPYCSFLGGQKNALVDVACGPGEGINSLYSKHYDCWGLDISPIIIQRNRNKYPRCNFLQYDCNREVFPSVLQSYDRVIALSVHSMEHVANVKAHVQHFLGFVHKYIVMVPYAEHFADCPEHINSFGEKDFGGPALEYCYVHPGTHEYKGLEESIVYVLRGMK